MPQRVRNPLTANGLALHHLVAYMYASFDRYFAKGLRVVGVSERCVGRQSCHCLSEGRWDNGAEGTSYLSIVTRVSYPSNLLRCGIAQNTVNGRATHLI
jgi:hypothetical protein